MNKFSYDMTKEERELHEKRKTYNKINKTMQYILKEMKVYEQNFIQS